MVTDMNQVSGYSDHSRCGTAFKDPDMCLMYTHFNITLPKKQKQFYLMYGRYFFSQAELKYLKNIKKQKKQ